VVEEKEGKIGLILLFHCSQEELTNNVKKINQSDDIVYDL
jgi:hypothetical protein